MHYQSVNELLTDKTYLNNSSLSGLVLMEYRRKRFVRQQFSSLEELCTKERMVFELFNAGISSDGKSVKPFGMFIRDRDG